MDPAPRNGTPQPAPDFSAIPVTLLAITALFSEDGTRLSRNETHIRVLEDDFRRRMREHPDQHPVQTPLRVVQRKERYLIIAGNYRYLAGLRIPLRNLPCQVLPHDLDELQLFIEQHRDNALHEGYSPVELRATSFTSRKSSAARRRRRAASSASTTRPKSPSS